MRPVLSLFLLLLACSNVHAQTLEGTSNMLLRATDRSLNFTSDTTTSIRDSKLVLAARDDAASFIASDGAIRTAQFEAALRNLREELPATREASDAALAQAILAR
ncbi:conserverd hypothetical protein [Pseudomonas pohangensis]|jgi:uncharacterized protein (TIGR02448 family)|uniref:DUF2388 domain-containing protein n=1 Tax=Pseudomonas pohangensis TaxID=364197 RepID=A0A1H2HS22_9PSED|nr:DUF2388 domain-containing protein [Pseudomonas pohangensis]SDU34700.1 conserverd hypothetical protein [Pseudomonas pohangensis]